MDRSGVSGYDAVDKLVKVLLSLQGDASIDNAEVLQIVNCWQQLSDYDKKPLIFPPQINRQTRKSHESQQKKRSAHTSIAIMRKYVTHILT